MTDEQARRIAQVNARRAGRGNASAGRQHKARKSRVAVLGLSVAAASGLVSGMWTQAAVASAEQVDPVAIAPTTTTTTTTIPPDLALQPNTEIRPVLIPGRNGAPDQVVYLVITRPTASSGADSLRSTTNSTPSVQVPSQATQTPSQVTQTPRPTINLPVTRSHGSR